MSEIIVTAKVEKSGFIMIQNLAHNKWCRITDKAKLHNKRDKTVNHLA